MVELAVLQTVSCIDRSLSVVLGVIYYIINRREQRKTSESYMPVTCKAH